MAAQGRSPLLLALLVAVSVLQCTSGCSNSKKTLDLTNIYRKAHGAKALKWDKQAASLAKKWATKLAKNGCNLQHSPLKWRKNMGENLFAVYGSSRADMCEWAIDYWYQEVSKYRFTSKPWKDNSPRFAAIGHFSQLVWKASNGLGCAAVKGKNCVAVACLYKLSGNVMGDSSFRSNVAKASPGNIDVAERMGKKLKLKLKLSDRYGRRLLGLDGQQATQELQYSVDEPEALSTEPQEQP